MGMKIPPVSLFVLASSVSVERTAIMRSRVSMGVLPSVSERMSS